jgi:serine/threonine protein kinase
MWGACVLEAGRQVDRYVIETVLGEGGMAVVYRVRHTTLGTMHALKVLSVSSRTVRDRMTEEGRVQAKLRHPHIVAVTDVFEVDGVPALLMEYIEGPSLDRWLASYQPTIEESLVVYRGILAGVGFAHDHGLVHRDLKPANVMLHVSAEGLTPKVTDFGLAKALQEEAGALKRTRTGMTMGTPAYMAPEQIRDASTVDHRADMYSLGCILYEMVTGRLPFDAPDIMSLFSAISTGKYTDPNEMVPGLPNEVRRAILACLQMDPTTRVAGCRELAELLDGDRPSVPGRRSLSAIPRLAIDTTAASKARELMHAPGNTKSVLAGVTPTPTWSDSIIATPGPAPSSMGSRSSAVSTSTEQKIRGGLPWIVIAAIVLGVGGGLLALLIAGVVVASSWSTVAPPTSTAVAPTMPAAAADSIPTPMPPTAASVPNPAPPAAVAPPVKPAKPSVPGKSESAKKARFRTTGDAQAVKLVGGSGEFSPGQSVPAGDYRIYVNFDGSGFENVAPLKLVAGDDVALKCVAYFKKCTKEKR